MVVEHSGFWLAVLQIIWIDILLSGDNAVVIALACRKLPVQQRVWGVVLGTLVAISLRVVFAGLVTTLMQMAYLKVVGGVLLLWIAVKLLGPEENGKSDHIQQVDNLWRAIRIVAIADLVMSLDNVIAIAAVAERFEAPQSYALLMFGLAVSIPLIMAGATLITALIMGDLPRQIVDRLGEQERFVVRHAVVAVRKMHIAQAMLLRERDIRLRAIDADDRLHAQRRELREGGVAFRQPAGDDLLVDANRIR